MTWLIFYSKRGRAIAESLKSKLSGRISLAAPARLAEDGIEALPAPSSLFFKEVYSTSDALIFICSCGIAVRMIAPFIKDKTKDPAVVVMDERAHHVISLLSGHMGGANKLTLDLAKISGARPVITTATDVNELFSVDTWAKEQDFHLSSMADVRTISSAILEGPIPLCTEMPITTGLPNGLYRACKGELGIFLGYELKEPFQRTLRIVPPVLHLGIGCRRGVPLEAIERLVRDTFKENQMDTFAIKAIHSIDLKADEEALIAFAEKLGVALVVHSSEALNNVKGDFTESSFVKSVTGTGNVCERAACMGAPKLIIRKRSLNGVTLAISVENREVQFV